MNNNEFLEVISDNQGKFHPVVPFVVGQDKLIAFDLTVANTELTAAILNDTRSFTAFINQKLSTAGARYGIGGYAEQRTVYEKSRLFDAENPGEEPRRLHLGTDIWGRPHTPVIAPLDALVHSFAFNNRAGDYGATIILSHNLRGRSFYTLFGHLGLSSLKNLQAGDRISGGDVIAEFGIPAENGHWPPHLHFQVILDIRDHKGDYPGVCKFSEREKYLENSPDPEWILQMEQYKTI